MTQQTFFDTKSRKNLKAFFSILFKYWKLWASIASLLLLVTLMKLPMPLLTGYIIDHVIKKNNIALLHAICGGILVITVIYLLTGYLKDYLLFCIQNSITIKIKLKLFRHIQSFPISEISKNEKGYLLARIMNDPHQLNGIFFDSFFALIQGIITLITGIAVIFAINWRLALLSLSILPFFIASNFLFIKKIKELDSRYKEQRAVTMKNLTESLGGVRITKLFSLYNREAIKFIKNMKMEFAISRKQFHIEYLVSLAGGFLGALGPLAVVWYGGLEIIRGNLTIGQLVAFSSLLGFLYNPAKSILSMHIDFQKSLVSLNRIFDILDKPGEENRIEGVKIAALKPPLDIEFKNVSFSYNGSAKVLENVSFKLSGHEKMAVIGPSGSGKSTLVHLLASFYEPGEGEIFIGNTNIKQIPLHVLRKNMGFMSQEDFLFSTTVYNNIKLGNPDAVHDEILEAARMANAYSFIQSLPQGFETPVGEAGDYLSGGQKQLIGLARVILKNPPLMILDEPTSAIDSETETLIRESLASFLKNKMAILISHRLSTISGIDKIMVIEKGRVSDMGNHAELMDRNEFYRKVFADQVENLT